MHHKKQNLHFYSSNIMCWQKRPRKQICLKLKVWMSSFLNIRCSFPEVRYKKGVLKSISKFIEKDPCCSLYFSVLNWVRFQHLNFRQRSTTLLKLQSGICAFVRIFKDTYFVERYWMATSVISSKNHIAASNSSIGSIIIIGGET